MFYHKVKKLFGYPDKEYVGHKVLIDKLSNDETIINNARLSNGMQVMKDERVQADYHVFKISNASIQFTKTFLDSFWKRYDNY